jgi:two-component sensor histidine kinase
MIVLALLPLGLLAMQQTADVARETARNREIAAMGATVQAAAPQVRLITAAQATASALAATVGPLLNDNVACRRMMDSILATEPTLTLVAYLPLSGQITCASGGNTLDLSGDPVFERMAAFDGPGTVVNPDGPVSHADIIGVTHPVFDGEGARIGFVSLSIRRDALKSAEDAAESSLIERPTALVTFDGDGRLLTSSIETDTTSLVLPRDDSLAALASGGARVFRAPDSTDAIRVYAVVRIAENLLLLGIWRSPGENLLVGPSIAPFLVPALMWVAALAVAVFAAEHLVTRHVRLMSSSMLAFARGDRGRTPLLLRNPPTEIADLSEAYRTMTATILRDEAELENLLHQKEALLREVHHRTGNSLQMIASVIRMHLREKPDPATRVLLEDLHSRVMSLSTVHISLYRMAGSADVAVHDLMADVIDKVSAIHERFAGKGAVQARLSPLVLPAEQAVPLALLVSEILSCFPPNAVAGEDLPIEARLDRSDESHARLQVSGPDTASSMLTGEGGDAPSRIAARLIRAFISQMGGELQITQQSPGVIITVIFPTR